MFHYTALYTDTYQLTMAQAYFFSEQKNHEAIFDYSFRRLPFEGGYAIFAGLDDLLNTIEALHFDVTEIDFLNKQGFHPDFLEYLKDFRFRGTIHACPEGEVLFPTSPILTVEANLIEAQLLETLLLNTLNFQSLIATKASRIRQVAGSRKLAEFGLRRAQGPGGYFASRAAMVGGFDATSNVIAGRDYAIPIVGTMAHSFIQSHENELASFEAFSKVWPDRCILLVDTYNTLDSGLPNAIHIAKEMEKKGQRLHGIRLDSGDLAYLSKKARQALDEAGLHDVIIMASNQLDEYVIKSLIEQGAPIDAFGVGTNLSVGSPDGAFDGVYKLAFSNGKPRIKCSESRNKISLPYKKQVYRVVDQDDLFLGADVVALFDEKELDIMYHPFEIAQSLSLKGYKKEPLLRQVMGDGKRLTPSQSLEEHAQYCQRQLSRLPMEYKRIINPHVYKVGLSEHLNAKRNQLIQNIREMSE